MEHLRSSLHIGLVFGNAFFAVGSSTIAFARLNFQPEAWPKAIGRDDCVFGVGQTLGPIAIGAITDAMGIYLMD